MPPSKGKAGGKTPAGGLIYVNFLERSNLPIGCSFNCITFELLEWEKVIILK